MIAVAFIAGVLFLPALAVLVQIVTRPRPYVPQKE